MSSTRVRRHVKAPRASVYRALLDPRGVSPRDNEIGWKMALAKLAVDVEADERMRRVVAGLSATRRAAQRD